MSAPRRLHALLIKESLQILRDPSTLLIALALPLVLLFIFGFGVNLDNDSIKTGIVLQHLSTPTASLASDFQQDRFLKSSQAQYSRFFERGLTAGRLRGLVVVAPTLARDSAMRHHPSVLQVITDGSEPSIARSLKSYAAGVAQIWTVHHDQSNGMLHPPAVTLQPRFWYNPELKSRYFLIPGSIAITMTLIGTLLTALVIAREWERGTMEAMMATPVSIRQILLGKLLPYYVLGLGSMLLCWLLAVFGYGVPFHGSFLMLLAATSVFLLAALGQGLLISSAAKDQFIASQVALTSAFLPAFMLSGFIFEISAMPQPIQWLTQALAARYYVSVLQTLFLSGNVWSLLWVKIGWMLLIALVFFTLTVRKLTKRLDV